MVCRLAIVYSFMRLLCFLVKTCSEMFRIIVKLVNVTVESIWKIDLCGFVKLHNVQFNRKLSVYLYLCILVARSCRRICYIVDFTYNGIIRSVL